jgi:GT2 family glycosyltransferase
MALDQSYPSFEVIVVDQSASIDSKVRAYVESSDKLRYLRLSPPNLPAARNVGIRAARGSIIVFIDDDVRIQRDYIALHARHYADPSVGGIMGSIVESFGAVASPNCMGPSEGDPAGGEHVAPAQWLVGGNTSYRRRAILDAGLCDERFVGTAWCEDADLSVRIRHAGYRLLRDSRIELIHLALPSGGCGNRDKGQQEARRNEQTKLFLFFVLKNRRILGYREVARSLIRSYRTTALNRPVIRCGPRELLRQHRAYVLSLVRAYRHLTSRPVI